MRPHALLATLGLVSLLLPPLAAQTAPSTGNAAEPPAFSAAIDVRVVNVEAVVTDRYGARVRGLKASDLRLLIDGQEVPIDYFAELGPGAPADAEAAALGAPKGRNLLVFLDDSFALKINRDMVLKKVAEQLDRLLPDDQVAVVSFDGDRLTVLSGWTSDKAVIAEVLAQAKRRPSRGIEVVAWRRSMQEQAEFEQVVAQALDLRPAGPRIGAESELNPQQTFTDPFSSGDPTRGERLYDRPAETLVGGFGTEAIVARLAKIPIAVMASMRAFADAPGRKIMMLMAGGWPSMSVAQPIAAEANRLGFTLYPVDVPGVDATFVVNDVSGSGGNSVPFTAGWELDAEYTLGLMARDTGGQAAYNGNRLAALSTVLEDTSTYYWMSFTPHWTGDDRNHQIEVEARRPGLEVRARRTFSDLSTATRTRLDARGILFFGGDEASRKLQVEARPVESANWLGQRIPFELSIPVGFFAAGHSGEKTLDLVLAAQSLDHRGTRRLFPETPVRLALDGDPAGAGAPSGLVPYTLALRLKQRSQRLVFTLRDPKSGAVIWGETQVAP